MNTRQHSIRVGIFLALAAAIAQADSLDNWHMRNAPPAENLLNGIAYGNGIYVAAGTSGILTSSDGAHWTEGPTNRDIAAIVFGNGRFVAVGLGPSLVSTNGTDWLEGEPGLAGNSPNFGNGLAYGNGLFVSAGAFGVNGPIYTSPDGLIWTRHNFSPFLGVVNMTGAAYGNGVFFVIGIRFGGGPFGVVSTDGTNWNFVFSSGELPTQVTFGNGLFAGGSVWHSIHSSPDGTNWTTQVTYDITNSFNGIGCANGVFGVVGNGGLIWTSSDAARWMPRSSGTTNDLYAFAGNESSFIAVGKAGTVLQSDDTRPRLSGQVDGSNGGAALSVTGGLLRNYRLQASDGLPATNWIDLLTFTNTQPTTNFVDTMATNLSRRFYRVVSP